MNNNVTVRWINSDSGMWLSLKRKLDLCTHIESQGKYKQAYICICIIFKEASRTGMRQVMLMKDVNLQKALGDGGDTGEIEKVALWIQSVRYLGFSEQLKNVKFPKF